MLNVELVSPLPGSLSGFSAFRKGVRLHTSKFKRWATFSSFPLVPSHRTFPEKDTGASLTRPNLQGSTPTDLQHISIFFFIVGMQP